MFLNKKRLVELSLTGFMCVAIAACGGSGSSSDDPVGEAEEEEEGFSEATLIAVLETNADIAFSGYSDSLATAEDLLTAIEALITTPTDENLTAAKQAWLDAREPYGQTEAYRFRLGPIDSTNGEDEDGPEGQINAWPLAEALIDYVATIDAGAAVDGADEAETFPPAVPDLDASAIAVSYTHLTLPTILLV